MCNAYRSESHDQTGIDMPLDVAVEQPDTCITGTEAEHEIAVWSNQDCITTHRYGGERDSAVPFELGVPVA